MLLPPMRGDQAAYLEYAKQMRLSGYAFEGDRNRMPLYPFLLSLIYRDGMDDAQFLEKARTFNINLTIVLLLGLFWIFRKFFPPFYSVALLAIAAFGLYIYRARVVHVEPLFYFVGFAMFVLLARILVAPGFVLAIAAGVVSGLAYLTKASALAALPILIVIFLAQSFFIARANAQFSMRDFARRLAIGGVLVASFLLSVFPYIWTNKQRYGEFFYNVNSAHYMWCDSWPEALSYSEELRNPETRKAALAKLPSAQKYWRTHSLEQATGRLLRGLSSLTKRSVKVVGYYKFVVLLGLTALVLAVQNRKRFSELLTRRRAVAVFCLMYFGGYLLLYAWYGAVVTDSRFVLTLFLPFVFSASILIHTLARDRTVSVAGRLIPVTTAIAAILIAFALVDSLYNAGRALF